MSLQKRLTLLFSALIGAVLLVFGILVYSLVNVILIDQIDQRLTSTTNEIISSLSVAENNSLIGRSLAEINIGENQYFQIWKNANQLILTRPLGYNDPLDNYGLQQGRVLFHTNNLNERRIRVLTVPLETSRGPVGVLQVGFDLSLIDITLNTLLAVLIFLLIIAVILGAISTWFLTRQALYPLVNVTEFAKQITVTNNYSRRIPLPEQNKKDEVFQLINSFNNTLEHLDHILSSQKRLMADVSHELRTPLTVIKGEIGLMRKFKQIDDDAISSIESEVDRLTRLVGNLLLITQADTGDLPMDFHHFQIDDLLCEIYHHMQVLAGEGLKINLQHVEPLQVYADRDRIKQVLVNLIGNAIQYTPPGGEVSLALEKVNENVHISIKDNGPGIAKDDLQHIFDRFYRGERSRSRTRGSGFGLGLSISQFIVQQHHGLISVESNPNEGTVFHIIFPIKANESSSPEHN
ncbi:MAG: hypothetical protein BGO78_00115 [Chloroflexi bacterium 44-23]|nr:MAG: hypothetical protein BGO78_00115 [Chloroflexi bacterium 44-23]